MSLKYVDAVSIKFDDKRKILVDDKTGDAMYVDFIETINLKRDDYTIITENKES